MAKPLFSLTATNKLSLDTDDGRQNGYTSIVRDNSGRLVAFYEKEWKSGRLSQSMVFATSGLEIQVDAGNGEINGVTVSWFLTSLTVPVSSYSLIYVSTAGVVLQTTDITSTLVQDIVVLAFIGSGVSAVVNVDVVERTGVYLFSKRQVLSGSEWVWDDYEYRLNVGRDPTASYDSVNNKMYVTFSKDGSTYVRVIDLADSLTWEYLSHVRIVGNVVYPDTDPQGTIIARAGASTGPHTQNTLFPLSSIGIGYRLSGVTVTPCVHVPFLNSAFNTYVSDGTIFCEVFEKPAGSYVLVDSFSIGKAETFTWRTWIGSFNTTLYFGVRLKHSLYVEVEFRTDPAFYVPLFIPALREFVTLSGSLYDAQLRTEIFTIRESGSSSVVSKTSEFDQLFKAQDDSLTARDAASSSVVSKTAEFDQLFSFYNESPTVAKVSASNSVVTQT
jgi:hypothetical protein